MHCELSFICINMPGFVLKLDHLRMINSDFGFAFFGTWFYGLGGVVSNSSSVKVSNITKILLNSVSWIKF